MLFLSKNKFIFALVCNILYAGQSFMRKSDIIPRGWRHANIFWHRWSSLLNGLPHRLTTPWPSLATAPAYHAVAVSRDHAGLQQGRKLTRPHRFTMPRPTHLSVPPLMLRSSLPSVSRGLIYINTPGRTWLDELFIDYEQVTTWEARFSSNKLEANYHILSAVVCTGWFNEQAHESRNYNLVNFEQLVGRSHWPSC